MTCCEDKANREVVEQAEGKVVEKCKVCGRRHIRIKLDPLPLIGKMKKDVSPGA